MSFLRLSSVQKTYPDGTPAVKGVSLDVQEGEFVVLLGPSGCGKTTTLRMVAGLETCSAGKIELARVDVTSLRPSQRDVGFVFQFYALYPHLSVRENVAFPLRCAGVRGAEIRARVDQVCRKVGISSLLTRYPAELSGGDRQRVALARAMVRRPRVYLMDEPLGTLDADRRLEMCEFIRAQQLELGVTTLYVTHDQEEAMSIADRIVVMVDGNIRQIGSPTGVYDDPADLFVAGFVGSPGMNLIDGAVERREGRPVFVPKRSPLALPLPMEGDSGPATLGIRPEYVHANAHGPLGGVVVLDEYLGSHRLVHVETREGRIVMRSSQPHTPGSMVTLGLDLTHCRLFDGLSGRSRAHV
jgi:multiple sugar transport system ATP-binding protein